ncbi:MAG: hypothetical protein JNJ58_02550 [Chitinophagaceae bacterium]|nr:hypothetical protein [Chitinophagaceae bacterium]
MKLTSILLFLTLCCSGHLWAQSKAGGNGNFIYFTMDGTEYKYDTKQVLSYTREDTAKGKEHKVISAFVRTPDGDSYVKMSIMFYMKLNEGIKPGKLDMYSILGYKKKLPCVYISLDKKNGDQYTFYGSKEGNKGSFEVTSVNGDWVEGSFSLTMPSKYGKEAALEITKGTFKFQIKK